MKGLPRIIVNLTSMTLMRVLSGGLSFLLIMLIARKWGPVFLGQFSTIFSYFMFLQQLPLLGLHLQVARAVAGVPEKAATETTNALAISFPMSVVLALALGIAGSVLYSVDMHLSLRLVGISCLPTALTVVAESVLTGQEKIHVVARTLIIENVFRVCSCLLFLRAGLGLSWLFSAFLFWRIVTAAIYWKTAGFASLVQPALIRVEEVFVRLKKVPVFFGILMFSIVFGRIDFILLSKLSSLEEVGYYSPAYRIYELGMMLPSMLALVMFPVFTRLWQGSKSGFRSLHSDLSRILFGLGMPLIIILAVSSEPLMIHLFGPEYTPSVSAMHLLAFTMMLMTLDQLQAAALLSAHYENIDLRTLAISFGMHIFLIVFLIPGKGCYGAALAALLTAIVRVTIRYYFTSKYLDLSLRLSYLASPVAASAVMCLVLWFVKGQHLGIALPVALTVYLLVLILTRGLTWKSLKTFHHVLTEGKLGF